MKLTRNDKHEIVKAIREAERRCRGEIRVHVRRACGEEVLGEARTAFARLGMHKTRERNGVLIFVASKSRRFAIVGDEGIHARTGDAFWNETRDKMKQLFSAGNAKDAIVDGVRHVGRKLAELFPAAPGDTNELPDRVTES